jgi:hypothetical protein
LGHRFTEGESAPHKVYVRVGYGDILLLKEPKNHAPMPAQ